jgi:hypothetical protein
MLYLNESRPHDREQTFWITCYIALSAVTGTQILWIACYHSLSVVTGATADDPNLSVLGVPGLVPSHSAACPVPLLAALFGEQRRASPLRTRHTGPPVVTFWTTRSLGGSDDRRSFLLAGQREAPVLMSSCRPFPGVCVVYPARRA